ncbi:MAG: sugar nucleotide-binding protein [bacterium]|nr:sugar nucleotide-binding protein [bacterium]
MKVYVTGSSGLVGSRFVELYSQKYNLFTSDYPQVDVTRKGDIEKIIKEENPDVIIHLAAYTNVTEGEKQRGNKNGDCWKINVMGTENLVSSIDPDKTQYIHISTDMVFGGLAEDPGPYSEDHLPETDKAKLTWYGYTKAQAERKVEKYLGKNSTIVRIIYPVRAKYDLKMDYLAKPLSLFDKGKLYPLFDDQQISIAFIDEIALALDKIIDKKLKGTFHVSSRDTTTPYELISYLIEKARGKVGVTRPSSVDNPVRYPMYGGLKTEKTQEILGIKFRSWKETIDEIVRQQKSMQ